jgi:hypothetical protein
MQTKNSKTEKYKLTSSVITALQEGRGKVSNCALSKIAIILTILVTIFSFLAPIQAQQNPSQKVTSEYMQQYAQTLIDNYIQLSNQYFPSSPNGLTFYSGLSYSIKYYSSSIGGSALWIEPANSPSFQTINTNERIEDVVFGKADWNLWPMFYGGTETMFSDFQVQLDRHPFLALANESDSALIHNILVNATYNYQAYTVVIIKASSNTNYWTSSLAREEAIRLLKVDSEHSFALSQEFVQLKGIPAIVEVMKHIVDNQNSTTYGVYGYLADLDKIKNFAIEAGLNCTLLKQLRRLQKVKV